MTEKCLPILQVQSARPASGMCWKIGKEIFGSVPKIQVSIVTLRLRSGQAVNPFCIIQPGSAFTKVSQRGAYAIIEDKKGNIWTTGSVNPPDGRVWALSRYDQKSLYNKNPAVTEIMSINGTGMLCGILEANDGSIWFGTLGPESGVYHYDGKTITDFKSAAGQQ
jgi:hypothetical protein